MKFVAALLFVIFSSAFTAQAELRRVQIKIFGMD